MYLTQGIEEVEKVQRRTIEVIPGKRCILVECSHRRIPGAEFGGAEKISQTKISE